MTHHSDPSMMTGQIGYERVENDFYATPPENLDVLAHYIDLSGVAVWEPACGQGHLSKALAKYAACVVSTDLIDRGFGHPGIDFLAAKRVPRVLTMNAPRLGIITNPPFGDLVEEFIFQALALTEPHQGMVAMFLRNEYDCRSTGAAEYFEGHPAFARKIVVTKRPRWFAGTKGSPRHNYAWFVWDWARADRGTWLGDQPYGPIINYLHPKNARPIRALENAA